MKNLSRRLGALTFTVLILALPITAWSFRQDIFDWSRLRGYQPSLAIKQLATKTTMNDHGRRLFYVYHPSLEPKQTFNSHCSESERTIVLGCYVSRGGIYIYDVTDDRLAGVEEVTAAHEMLHAAYDRLKPQEKQRLNNLLGETFTSLKDVRISAAVDKYRQKDPNIVPNELHSILGTEVMDLPKELEAYYKRYFSNRSAIVTLSQQYEQAFDDRRNSVAADDEKLKALKAQIDGLDVALESQKQVLNAQRAKMDKLIANNQVTEYNNAVPEYNQQVATYNVNVVTAKSLIETYNALVKERNNLVLEENELIKAIDSRPSTLNSQ